MEQVLLKTFLHPTLMVPKRGGQAPRSRLQPRARPSPPHPSSSPLLPRGRGSLAVLLPEKRAQEVSCENSLSLRVPACHRAWQ